jgi:hypothetical protein
MTSTALIPHASRCSRPTPILRTSWDGNPEISCPACGRSATASDSRSPR